MGLVTIRLVAFLDILLTVAIISQQATYTKRLSDEYKQPQPCTTPKPETKNLEQAAPTKSHQHIFRGNRIQNDGNHFFTFHAFIPEKWLWPLLFLIVGVGLMSILISTALIVSTGPAYTFQNACSMFTIWLNFFAFTFVLAVILFILGFHVAILVIYSFAYVCIRSVFVLILVDDFVNLVFEVSSTAIPINRQAGFFDDFWNRLELLKEGEKLMGSPLVDTIPPYIVMQLWNEKEGFKNLVEIKSEVPPLVFENFEPLSVEIVGEEGLSADVIEELELSVEGTEVVLATFENSDEKCKSNE